MLTSSPRICQVLRSLAPFPVRGPPAGQLRHWRLRPVHLHAAILRRARAVGGLYAAHRPPPGQAEVDVARRRTL